MIKSFQEVIPDEKIHIEPSLLFVVNSDHFIGVTISIFSNKTGLHLTMEYPLENFNTDEDSDFLIEKTECIESDVPDAEYEVCTELLTLKEFHNYIMNQVKSKYDDEEALEELIQSMNYYSSFFVVDGAK